MYLLIAHGASGNAGSMRPHVEGLASRGLPTTAVDLPLRKAESAVSDYRAQLAACPVPAREVMLSGQSYGGRVASLLAADDDTVCAGLICFSYPLHRPGQPEWEARTSHWPRLAGLPVLLLSGESDPFARLDLLQRAVEERLPTARLVTYPRVGHSLRSVLQDALDQAAAFALGQQAAGDVTGSSDGAAGAATEDPL